MIFLQRFPEKYCKFETKKPRNLGSKTFAMKSLKTSLKDYNVRGFKKHQHLYMVHGSICNGDTYSTQC